MTAYARQFGPEPYTTLPTLPGPAEYKLGNVEIFNGGAMLTDESSVVIHWTGPSREDWEIDEIRIPGVSPREWDRNPVLAGIRKSIIDQIDGGKSPTLLSEFANGVWEDARS